MKVDFFFWSQKEKQIPFSRSVAWHLTSLAYTNRVQHATTPGFHHAEKTSFVSTNAISEREGGGPGHGFGWRIAELSIYLPSQSAFWRIVFDWLPSDTKRALSCEMHQDFGANARVPPKSALGRLENTSSAVSLPNQCPGSLPSLYVHYLSYTKRPSSAKPQYNAFNRTVRNVRSRNALERVLLLCYTSQSIFDYCLY